MILKKLFRYNRKKIKQLQIMLIKFLFEESDIIDYQGLCVSINMLMNYSILAQLENSDNEEKGNQSKMLFKVSEAANK